MGETDHWSAGFISRGDCHSPERTVRIDHQSVAGADVCRRELWPGEIRSVSVAKGLGQRVFCLELAGMSVSADQERRELPPLRGRG